MPPSPRTTILGKRVLRKFKKHASKMKNLRAKTGLVLSQIAGGSSHVPRNTAAQLRTMGRTPMLYIGNVYPNYTIVRTRAAAKLARIRNIQNKQRRGEALTPNEIKFLFNYDPSRMKAAAYRKNRFVHRIPTLMRTVASRVTNNPGYQTQGMRNVTILPSGMYIETPYIPGPKYVSKSVLKRFLTRWLRIHRDQH